jgi:hypothetical protein
MNSLLGLITLFLRLSLAIQGQLIEFSDVSNSTEQIHCKEYSASQKVISAGSDWLYGNINLVRKLEKEERVEVEGENSLDFSEFVSGNLFKQDSKLGSNSIFGNKAIRGSLPPLYDFFHSWKIHLS